MRKILVLLAISMILLVSLTAIIWNRETTHGGGDRPMPRLPHMDITLSALPYSSYEPSFVMINCTVGNEKYVLYGGLWSVANGSRTIDAEPSPWAAKDPNITYHSESEWYFNHASYVLLTTVWDWGRRDAAIFTREGLPLVFISVRWSFNKKIQQLLDPYWEQTNCYSADYSAYVVYEDNNGKIHYANYKSLKNNMSIKYISQLGHWVWLNHTRSGLPVGFILIYEDLKPWLLLGNLHGNDVTFDWFHNNEFKNNLNFNIIITIGLNLSKFMEFESWYMCSSTQGDFEMVLYDAALGLELEKTSYDVAQFIVAYEKLNILLTSPPENAQREAKLAGLQA